MRSSWIAVAAGVAWLLGRIVLGSRWDGVEVAPGVWRDGVGLWQWAMLWLLLAGLGLATARRLRGWAPRLLVLAPLLAWLAWSLREGNLGLIPVIIYGVPTVIAWCCGLLARDATRPA
jgi:hypothetical protein